MAVIPPGAGSAGTASDRLALLLRQLAGANEYPGASYVIYIDDLDGTSGEIHPDAAEGPAPGSGLLLGDNLSSGGR
ncbi:hypothetical protein AB0A05_27440 [Streptomyces sp. NPDC046374]|uniref:hypothetical protein n=1 Tax=Streptomyces sp. NPDC046374 TaxID=3154917 RepID=UPI0033C1FC35